MVALVFTDINDASIKNKVLSLHSDKSARYIGVLISIERGDFIKFCNLRVVYLDGRIVII